MEYGLCIIRPKMEMRGVKGSLVISIVSDRDPRFTSRFWSSL